MAGLSLDLTKFFGGKGVVPMSGIFLGGTGYLILSNYIKLPVNDAIAGGLCFGILSVLIFIGIGEVSARVKRRKKFKGLTPFEIKYITDDLIRNGEGYSSHSIEFSPLMELEDKGIISKLTAEGSNFYKFKITDWAWGKIRKDNRFKDAFKPKSPGESNV